jgi:hypothetical protein
LTAKVSPTGRDGIRIEVVIRIHDPGQSDLMVVGALGAFGLFFGLRQRGQQHRGENRDDGDHDQQFDQGETSARSLRLVLTPPRGFYDGDHRHINLSNGSVPGIVNSFVFHTE